MTLVVIRLKQERAGLRIQWGGHIQQIDVGDGDLETWLRGRKARRLDLPVRGLLGGEWEVYGIPCSNAVNVLEGMEVMDYYAVRALGEKGESRETSRAKAVLPLVP